MNNASTYRNAVAAEVRAALARDGRTAESLATDAGISRGALSRKMRGLVPFTVEELLSVAAALNIAPGSLIAATQAHLQKVAG